MCLRPVRGLTLRAGGRLRRVLERALGRGDGGAAVRLERGVAERAPRRARLLGVSARERVRVRVRVRVWGEGEV